MIVVALIAMVSGGVAVMAIRQAERAKLTHAATSARELRTAVQTYWLLESTNACPTVSELVEAQVLDEGANTEDPWGGEWRVNCDDGRIRVASAGPDRRAATKDDIVVPKEKSE